MVRVSQLRFNEPECCGYLDLYENIHYPYFHITEVCHMLDWEFGDIYDTLKLVLDKDKFLDFHQPWMFNCSRRKFSQAIEGHEFWFITLNGFFDLLNFKGGEKCQTLMRILKNNFKDSP